MTGQGQAAGPEHRSAPEQLLLCKELPVRNTEVQACLGGSLGFLIAQFLSSVSFSPPPLEYTRIFWFCFSPKPGACQEARPRAARPQAAPADGLWALLVVHREVVQQPLQERG